MQGALTFTCWVQGHIRSHGSFTVTHYKYECAHEKTFLMPIYLQWCFLPAQLQCLQGWQFYKNLTMEYSCSHAVFLLYEALFKKKWNFQPSDTKFCANLKICKFSTREVFPRARSYMLIASLETPHNDIGGNVTLVRIWSPYHMRDLGHT